MKHALLAILLLASTPACADDPEAVDDYAACLIGRAAVALHAQPAEKDVDKALEIAYQACPPPPDSAFDEEAGIDGVDDMVLFTTEKIAGVPSKSWERIGG